jgi:hypothetical protein
LLFLYLVCSEFGFDQTPSNLFDALPPSSVNRITTVSIPSSYDASPIHTRSKQEHAAPIDTSQGGYSRSSDSDATRDSASGTGITIDLPPQVPSVAAPPPARPLVFKLLATEDDSQSRDSDEDSEQEADVPYIDTSSKSTLVLPSQAASGNQSAQQLSDDDDDYIPINPATFKVVMDTSYIVRFLFFEYHPCGLMSK